MMESETREYPTNEKRLQFLKPIEEFLTKYHQRVWFTEVGGLREFPDYEYIEQCRELFPTGMTRENPEGGQFSDIDFLYAEHDFRESALGMVTRLIYEVENGEFEERKHSGGATSVENESKDNPWGLFNSQLVLLYSYGLEAMNVTPSKMNSDKSNFARLLHVLIEKDADARLDNSGLYKIIKQGLGAKEVKGSIDDLLAVRAIFERIGFAKAIKLVNIKLRQEGYELKR